MARCAATKVDGTACERIVGSSQTYCYSHDESRARERHINASTAAKSKKIGGELGAVKQQLREIADGVLEGTLDKGKGSVAAQVLGVYTRVIEAERKLREQDLLLQRLEELEQTLQGRKPWGA